MNTCRDEPSIVKARPHRDTELFLRVKGGEKEAFTALFRKYYPKVLNVAYRFLPNRHHAEDIAQDVFLRVFRGAKDFVPAAKFSTWLYTITVNCCLTYVKKLRRDKGKCLSESEVALEEEREAGFTLEQNPSADGSPEGDVLQGESVKMLQDALDTLSPDQKMAFILLHYGELSYREIAEASGSTTKAVERRIYHARQKLQELLKPYLTT